MSDLTNPNKDKVSKSLKVTLAQLEEKYAVLLTENKEEIKWPKEKLPANLKIGDIFYLAANNNLGSGENKKEMVKIMLEEILNGGEE